MTILKTDVAFLAMVVGVGVGVGVGTLIGCADRTDEPRWGAILTWSSVLAVNCGISALFGGILSIMIRRGSRAPLALPICSVVGSLIGVYVESGSILLILDGAPVNFSFSAARAVLGAFFGLLIGTAFVLFRRQPGLIGGCATTGGPEESAERSRSSRKRLHMLTL